MAINRAHNRAKSILFDIELDDVDGAGFTARDALAEWLAGQQGSQEQAKLTDDAHQAHVLALSPSGEVSLERFAQLLAMRGHHVWLRTGRLDCCSGTVALRHTFVLAGAAGTVSSDLMPQLFVVDPCFKEQFQLPNATPEYTALWQDLPNLFVGTAEQLVPIVELMCTEMQRVFADCATSCPPWRTPSCMLTKWLPTSADDVPVAAPGSTDSCSSTRPSSSATNSSLSSPIRALGQPSSRAELLLAPIRTPVGGADMAEGPAGLTPRSARSPLYFENDTPARHVVRRLTSSPTAAELDEHGLQRANDAVRAKQPLFVHWAANDAEGSSGLPLGAAVAAKAADSDSCFMASGSWGLGTFSSTVSSPECDVVFPLLRNCYSETGGPRPQERSNTRSMAIAARVNPRCDQGGNGFAAALVERAGLGQLQEFSPDAVGLAARHVSDTAMQRAPAAASRGTGSGFFCGYRSHVAAGNPTLDISRFDRDSGEDNIPPAGPLAWGLGAERFGSGSSMGLARKLSSNGNSSKPAGAGSMCPPVRRRSSPSGNSQCSALSAAIAGKGVPMR